MNDDLGLVARFSVLRSKGIQLGIFLNVDEMSIEPRVNVDNYLKL